MNDIELRKLSTHNESLARENERLKADNKQLREETGAWLSYKETLLLTIEKFNRQLKKTNTMVTGHQEIVKQLKEDLTKQIEEKYLLKVALTNIIELVYENPQAEAIGRVAKTALNSWKEKA